MIRRAKEYGIVTGKIRMFVGMLIALGAIGMGANSAYAAGTQVPFVGSYSGTATPDFPNGTISFSGTGISTTLGLSANAGRAVITGPDSSCPGGLANVNVETLTGPNGDSITFTSHDVACPVGGNVFQGTGHWVVTGGTGRFTGATGQGRLVGRGDFNQGLFSFQLTGAISAPNGS